MFKLFKNQLSKPCAEEIAKDDLAEAKRQLLNYQSQSEYAEQMVIYYTKMVDRLTKFIG